MIIFQYLIIRNSALIFVSLVLVSSINKVVHRNRRIVRNRVQSENLARVVDYPLRKADGDENVWMQSHNIVMSIGRREDLAR